MPTAIVLSLSPTAAATLPAFLGRAAHAWFLDQVRELDPALNRALHAPDVRKPFTVSPVWGAGEPAARSAKQRSDRVRFRAGEQAYLRVTLLTPEIEAAVRTELVPRWREATVHLSGVPLRVQAVATEPAAHPQAATIEYAALRRAVEFAAAPAAITLHFRTPTVFRQSPPPDSPFATDSYNVPLPEPARVFGSLLATWNDFAPDPLPESLPAYLRDGVAVTRYRLHTELVSFGSGRRGRVGGFVGTCTFALLGSDAALCRAVGMLAALAPFAGVGWRTTMGLGQTAHVIE